MNEINVIGLGFVGLTTALGFSHKKLKVIGVENNEEKLKKIKNGVLPFYEPFLKEKLKSSIKNRKILFRDKVILNKNKLNIIFVCLGTPSNENGSTNFKQILDFLNQIKKNLENEKILFVIKSTVPPYSIDKIFKNIFVKNKNVNFCSNPEFLREGSAWEDFFKSGKIVIGCENQNSKRNMVKIYKNFKDKKIFVNNVSAEFIKYLSNSMLANMISFSNDMAMLGEKIENIDIKKAFEALKMDNRWNGNPSPMKNYYHPGMGYGGYCLPKDVKSFLNLSKKYKYKSILNEIDGINKKIFDYQCKKILKVNKKLNLFILGLSFKPGSDDLRSSKSIQLVQSLLKKKRKITAFDPVCFRSASKILRNKIKIYKQPFINRKAIYVLSTAWPQYVKFLSKIDKNNIIDLRYVI